MPVINERLAKLELDAAESERIIALSPQAVQHLVVDVLEARAENTTLNVTTAARNLLDSMAPLNKEQQLYAFKNHEDLCEQSENVERLRDMVRLAKKISHYRMDLSAQINDVCGACLKKGDVVKATCFSPPVIVFTVVSDIYEDGTVIVRGPYGLGNLPAATVEIVRKATLVQCLEEVGDAANLRRLSELLTSRLDVLTEHASLSPLALLDTVHDYLLSIGKQLRIGGKEEWELERRKGVLKDRISGAPTKRRRTSAASEHAASDSNVIEALMTDPKATRRWAEDEGRGGGTSSRASSADLPEGWVGEKRTTPKGRTYTRYLGPGGALAWSASQVLAGGRQDRKAKAPTTIPIGTRVELRGLQARPELNGHRGVVASLNAASGRYDVTLDDARGRVAIKRENMKKISQRWHTAGPFMGHGVRRSIFGDGGDLVDAADAQIVGYLPADKADFKDAAGEPAALWRIRFAGNGLLAGDFEDLEEYEVLEGMKWFEAHLKGEAW